MVSNYGKVSVDALNYNSNFTVKVVIYQHTVIIVGPTLGSSIRACSGLVGESKMHKQASCIIENPKSLILQPIFQFFGITICYLDSIICF